MTKTIINENDAELNEIDETPPYEIKVAFNSQNTNESWDRVVAEVKKLDPSLSPSLLAGLEKNKKIFLECLKVQDGNIKAVDFSLLDEHHFVNICIGNTNFKPNTTPLMDVDIDKRNGFIARAFSLDLDIVQELSQIEGMYSVLIGNLSWDEVFEDHNDYQEFIDEYSDFAGDEYIVDDFAEIAEINEFNIEDAFTFAEGDLLYLSLLDLLGDD